MTVDKARPRVPCSESNCLEATNERWSASRGQTLHNVAVKLGNISYIVEVTDICAAGAQICVRHGLMPAVGQLVSLQFMNGIIIESEVVWENGTSAGLSFRELFADVADVVHFDDLGADYFGAVLRYQLAVVAS
jgi:hypothetical protein